MPLTEKQRKFQSQTDKYRNENLKMYDPDDSNYNEHQCMFQRLLDQIGLFYMRESHRFTYESETRYYMDFFIPYYQIDIEIDGRHHAYGKRKKMDETKTNYYKTKKYIKTIRFWNEDVEKMDTEGKFNEQLFLEKLSEDGYLEKIEKHFRNAKKSWTQNYAGWAPHIDITKEVFLFNTENAVTYRYDNVLELQRAIGKETKWIIRSIERDLRSINTKYIISFTDQKLQEQIEVWNLLRQRAERNKQKKRRYNTCGNKAIG